MKTKLNQQIKHMTCIGLATMAASWCNISAQETQTASQVMEANPVAPFVPYDISDDGVEQPVRWGIDTAWLWDWWPLRATNHMRECVSLGRVTIDPRTNGTYTELDSSQKERLDLQLSWLVKSGVKDLYLLCGNASGTAWQTSYRTSFIADIAMGVEYLKGKGYTVIAIAPFNEPDYWANNAPSPEEMATVSRMIHENSTLAHIDICGPNTLNPDYAYSWWGIMQNDVQIGNTHQLAGSFDSFAGFYAAVAASGKKSAGDELHNINDALIGMNYGMSAGIWWSDYGGYTRAELGCASNDGSRIGYKENRAAWTSAAVFKRKSCDLVEAFLGSSERQAGDSPFTFVSKDRLAYYDGYGPFYEYTKTTPGGTGYQTGQTNSEYVIEITHGEDVPVGPISGNFKIVNKATGKLLSVTAGTLSNGNTICQSEEGAVRYQTWNIHAIDPRSSGDFSYVNIYNAANESNKYYLDAVKYAASNGAGVIVYTGEANECERWHLRYKGDGYYVITNHDSGLSLEGSSNNSDSNTTGVVQWERTGNDRQLWRFVPANATVETTAPNTPTGLQATGLSGSIELTWNANNENDLLGYMVYRFNDEAGIWETIGRQVVGEKFVDNILTKGKNLKYRLRAVDKAWNLSQPSEEVTAITNDEPAQIAHWKLQENPQDLLENALHATPVSSITYSEDDIHNGAIFNGQTDYINLPYHVGDMKQMTLCAWVNPSSTASWQRIFDFGCDTDNYLFLTTSNGSSMRFEICKDGVKQGVNTPERLAANEWAHVAVTISEDSVKIFQNGNLVAETADITLRPSDIHPTLCFIGRSMFDSDPLFKGIIGDIKLYNYPLEADKIKLQYYDAHLEAAYELYNTPMRSNVRTQLLESIQATEAAIKSGDEASIQTTMEDLDTAMSNAKKSASAYAPLGEALEWSRNLALNYPQNDEEAKAAYEEAFAAQEASFLNGEFTPYRITAEVNATKKYTNQYLMSDATTTASETNPIDITHLIINPDFSDNSLEGWTLTTSETGYQGNVKYNCFEVWNHTFNLSQALYGMPLGTYRLKAQAFYRNGSKENCADKTVYAMLYINSETAEISPIARTANSVTSDGEWYEYSSGKNVPNDMEAASAAFNKLLRYQPGNTNYAVTAENTLSILTIGMKKTTSIYDDWSIVNNFKLQYLGNESSSIDLMVKAEKETIGDGHVYDLTGRKVASISNPEELKGLSPGIYIVNGKKWVVK